MKNLRIPILAAYLLCFALQGCYECRNDDCPAHPEFAFKVLDEKGKSLAGVTPFTHVNSDSIQVVGLDENEERVNIKLSQDGSILRFRINHAIENYLIRYSFAKDDSLLPNQANAVLLLWMNIA